MPRFYHFLIKQQSDKMNKWQRRWVELIHAYFVKGNEFYTVLTTTFAKYRRFWVKHNTLGNVKHQLVL